MIETNYSICFQQRPKANAENTAYPHPGPPQALRREDARSSSARMRTRKGTRIRRSHPQAVIQQACAKYCGSRHYQPFSLRREEIGSCETERETVVIRIPLLAPSFAHPHWRPTGLVNSSILLPILRISSGIGDMLETAPPKELHPSCVQQIDVSSLAASLLHQGTHP